MKIKSLLTMTAFAVIAFISIPVFAQSQLALAQRVELLEQQAATRNQIQSDMSMRLIQLQSEVKELRGIIEEHEYKLQQIQERQRDIYRDIDSRFSNIQPASVQNKSNTTTSSVNVTPPSVVTPSQTINTSDSRAEFEASFALVKNKQYPEAVKGFEAFLKKYPKGPYSDNARFWIGQVYYAQSDFVKAEKQFLMLQADFPDSTKLPSALIKLAEIKEKQQKWQEAKDLYNQVISKFTGTTQQLARKGLQDLKAAGH